MALAIGVVSRVDGDEAAAIPADQSQAMRTLVDELVRLGLPDTAGAKYFVGPAYVQQQLDPAQEEPVLPMRYARIQETVPESTEMIYKSIVPGPHFRLADGRWLLSLGYLLTPSDRQQVFTRKTEQRELKQVMADAEAAFPFEPDAEFDEWFRKIPAADLEAMKTGVKQGVSLWQYLELPRNNTTLGVCFLLRAGASDAEILSYTIADTRCRDFWRMQPWTGPALPFDPTGQNDAYEAVAKKWEETHKTYDVEPLSVAFRRDLNRYFFHMLMHDESPYEPVVAAALARATLDDGDPQQLEEKIAALVASASLPATTAEDAELAARLQSWGDGEAKMIVKNSSAAGDRPSITTVLERTSSNYTPSRKDLPELFELLDDSRPTRWVDYQGDRSVGESALRAIAIVLEKNPLELVRVEATAPWTEETRAKANGALREWWGENRSKYTK
jgi:hypothetical protein